MKYLADRILAFLLSRRSMVAFNRLLLMVAFRGLGLGNWRSGRGERLFLTGLSRRLPGDAVILDIGANQGAYASLVRAAMPGARIFAFEPLPGNVSVLTKAARTLGFDIIPCAVGAALGTMTLFDYVGGAGSSHASAFREVIEEHHVSDSHGESRAVDVPVTTVDAFLDERGIGRVDLMKIDVEGFEFQVLEGASQALSDHRIGMSQFEFSEINVYARNFFHDFRALLAGFDLYRILDNGELLPLADQPLRLIELFHYQNLVARRREPGLAILA